MPLNEKALLEMINALFAIFLLIALQIMLYRTLGKVKKCLNVSKALIDLST